MKKFKNVVYLLKLYMKVQIMRFNPFFSQDEKTVRALAFNILLELHQKLQKK